MSQAKFSWTDQTKGLSTTMAIVCTVTSCGVLAPLIAGGSSNALNFSFPFAGAMIMFWLLSKPFVRYLEVGLLIVLLSLFVIGIELVRSLMFLIQTKGGTIALCDFLGSFTVLVGTVLLFLAYMFDMNEFVKQKSKIDIPLLGDDCEHLEPATFED